MKKSIGKFFVFFLLTLSSAFAVKTEEMKIDNSIYKAEDRNKAAVIEILDNDIQYQILSEGSGEPISICDVPLIHIKCSLPNGETFIESYKFVSSLNDLPEGLKLAMEGMKEHETRNIYIDSKYVTARFNPENYDSLLILEVTILKSDKSKIYALDSDAKRGNRILR